MKFDDLDQKMRVFEMAHDLCVLPGLYMVARLDGRSFTRLTKEVHQFEAPFDPRFRDLMVDTAAYLMGVSDSAAGVATSDPSANCGGLMGSSLVIGKKFQRLDHVPAFVQHNRHVLKCPLWVSPFVDEANECGPDVLQGFGGCTKVFTKQLFRWFVVGVAHDAALLRLAALRVHQL